MNREESKQVLMVTQSAFPNWKIPDKTVAVNLWQTMFADYDYQLVMTALQTYITSDRSGFAPSIGQLLDIIRKLTTEEDMNGNEAWALVNNALRNSTYNSQAEFDKLPPAVQKAVGSPNMLYQWATDENYNESVTSSNFLRAYKVVCDRERERAMLPNSAKTLLAARTDVKMIGG